MSEDECFSLILKLSWNVDCVMGPICFSMLSVAGMFICVLWWAEPPIVLMFMLVLHHDLAPLAGVYVFGYVVDWIDVTGDDETE